MAWAVNGSKCGGIPTRGENTTSTPVGPTQEQGGERMSTYQLATRPRVRPSFHREDTPRNRYDSGEMVAPTGVDPVTFRFSVERSTN